MILATMIASALILGIAKETNSIIDNTIEIERLATKTEILSSWSDSGLKCKQCTCKAPKTMKRVLTNK